MSWDAWCERMAERISASECDCEDKSASLAHVYRNLERYVTYATGVIDGWRLRDMPAVVDEHIAAWKTDVTSRLKAWKTQFKAVKEMLKKASSSAHRRHGQGDKYAYSFKHLHSDTADVRILLDNVCQIGIIISELCTQMSHLLQSLLSPLHADRHPLQAGVDRVQILLASALAEFQRQLGRALLQTCGSSLRLRAARLPGEVRERVASFRMTV